MQNLVCAECKCSPNECKSVILKCKNCIKKICCCNSIYNSKININSLSFFVLFNNIKKMYAAALGIEILCIMSAEIGENIGLYTFGFNLHGIVIAYVLGYALAGFSTFMTILGRYDFNSNNKIDGCCSFLEQNSNKGFLFNLLITFQNFKKGFEQLIHNRNNPKTKYIFKTSIIILVTAESACILTAETADLLFYQYSLFLSITLALLIGTFTLVAIESYKKMKSKMEGCICDSCNSEFIFFKSK